MKLAPLDTYGEFYWIGHPACENANEAEQKLISRRDDIEFFGGIIDEEASYSYDEFALIRLDKDFYLLQTSGCSCPSPSETWVVDLGPAKLKEIEEYIKGGHYAGYTLPKKKEAEFLALIASAKPKRRTSK